MPGAHDAADDLNAAIKAVSTYVSALLDSDVGKLAHVWHPLGRSYSAAAHSSALVEHDREALFREVAARSPGGGVHRLRSRIVTVERQEGAPGSPQDGVMVWAQVEVALPPTASGAEGGGDVEDELCTDLLVLFNLPEGWRIISRVCARRPLSEPAVVGGRQASAAAAAAVHGCVDAYYSSGHASDPDAMGLAYHPACRLTAPSSQQGGGLLCWAQEDFFLRVAARPPSAGLALVERHDNVSKVVLAGNRAALVVCQIAYPPLLFTDVLSLLKVRGNDLGWWIICKSSVSAPLPPA